MQQDIAAELRKCRGGRGARWGDGMGRWGVALAGVES